MANNKVKANKENISGYDSELDIDVGDAYEAYFKGSIPEPTQYNDGSSTMTITWFNNFGVRDKASKADANVEYTVKLKKLPAGKRLFVKDAGGNVIEVSQKSANDPDDVKLKYSDDDDVKKIKFKWNVGDPATGLAP
ncbi:MAG TPA: hypothetical protein VIS72_09150 [Anaerolineales bacterium]